MNIRDLFRNKATVTTATIPSSIQAGDRFRLQPRDNGDPFPPKQPHAVATILEIRSGWVRYRLGNGHMFGDERMELRIFEKIYERIT